MNRFQVLLLSAVLAIVLPACTSAPESSDIDQEAVISDTAGDYEHTLFDDSFVHEINVSMSEEDWEDLLANPV